MQPTERLYFTDSSLLDFTASVLQVNPSARGFEVVLDRTAFYPTGGGQPHDTGWLGQAQVVDVYEDEAGVITHLIPDAQGVEPGQSLHGVVDAKRRLDHLQQHSGQHILSQAFVQACGAETRSFHLGSDSCTIDIDLKAPTMAAMSEAEDVANSVIFEDRPMRIHLVNEEEAERLPLRKESAVKGTIRVIEVEAFDWSPCGGTHASRTGQIGLIAIKSFARVKNLTRVEFVCGSRALKDYRAAHATATAVATLFNTERDISPEHVARALQENKSLKKRVRELLNLAIIPEAQQLLSQGQPMGSFKLVQAIFNDRDPEELRILALKIVETEPSAALLASRADSARLVFARSASVAIDMGALLKQSCQLLGGRGGGKPDLAQGGGPALEQLDWAISQAAEAIRQLA